MNMDLCVISDIHGCPAYIPQLADIDYDLLVICGDITDFGHYTEARSILQHIPHPFLAIHGNCDHEDVLPALNEMHCNLHENIVVIREMTLAGFGGSTLFMRRTPSEYTEEKIYRGLSSIPQHAILVTHAPPVNTLVDKAFTTRHVGSTAVRKIIEEKEPPYALCGHIHESKNSDRIGNTIIINPGAFSRGYYAVLSTDTGEYSLERLS
jgi:hypothetical protein